MNRFAWGARALGVVLLVLALERAPNGRPLASPPEPGVPAGPPPATASAPSPDRSPALVVPARARSGRAFRVEIRDEGGANADVVVDGATVEPAPALSSRSSPAFRVTPAGEGWHEVRARLANGEALRAWVDVGPPAAVGWRGPPGPIGGLLEASGFTVAPGGGDAADLLVATGAIEDPVRIEALVREGRGLALFGRAALESIASTGWAPVSPVPIAASPTESAPTAPAESAPAPPVPPEPSLVPERTSGPAARVALLLLLDRSGSMAGRKLARAKEAAVASAETLAESDLVGVIAFDTAAEEVSPLESGAPGPALRSRLERVRAGGGTRFSPALRLAGDTLGPTDAGIRHAVLLSDGMTEDWASVDYGVLVADLRRRGITLSTVGLLDEGDRGDEPLAHLAKWGGGRFYPVRSPDEVPQVFTLEARRIAAPETPRLASAPAPEGLEPTASAPADAPPDRRRPDEEEPGARRRVARLAAKHDALGGFDPAGAPALAGHVTSIPAAAVAVPLVADPGGEPLLAIRPLGRGWVAAWCAEPGGPWIASWSASGHLARFLGPLAEFLRRPEPAGDRWSLAANGAGGVFARPSSRREGEPPVARETLRALNAWTRLVRLDPPLVGDAEVDASGTLRSTLRVASLPPPSAPRPLRSDPANAAAGSARAVDGGRGAALAAAAVALAAAEAAGLLARRRQRLSPRPSLRAGASGASGAGSR